MNEEEYVAALLQHLQPGPVYFASEHCILCSHGRCTLEHREYPQDGELPPQGDHCYICWRPTAGTDELRCSHSPLHRVHHDCLKQWGPSRCGICNTGRFGAWMNTTASLHVLCDLRHIRRELPPFINIPIDEHPAEHQAPEEQPREAVFNDLLRLWKCIGALVVFALVLNAVVSVYR